MKQRIATTLILVVMCTAAVAQTGTRSTARNNGELAAFQAFIEEHPRALADLKKNPSAVDSPQFISEYPRVGEYLSNHPQVRAQLKSNPRFFDGLNATSQGGQHHWWSRWWKQKH